MEKKIVDFNKFRTKYIEQVEETAKEKYHAVKIDDDSYILPSNVVNTANIDMAFIDSELYQDEELKKAIQKMRINNEDFVSLWCTDTMENGNNIIQAVNMSCDEKSEMNFILKVPLTNQNRINLLNMIAYYNKDKSADISFFLNYDFNMLKELIKYDDDKN